jgi:hypothetical protein
VKSPVKHSLALLCGIPLAAGLAACAGTTSTAAFKGEAHEVAQAISQLQSDATAGDQKKICANDLASAVVARVSSAPGGCDQAIKNELAEVDNFELSIQKVQLMGPPARRTATASVKSTYSGKTTLTTVSLVKEGGKWKVSGVG